ncbi:MAG: adenylosuccinate lyase [Salinivirgaceae bacterium]|nr:adenylosuccinate lyase [Salinivirgaceae bacterium]MDD4747651.1 adenylosuccinate lyase [Salinivirgaceae bacterium]MDY0279243.1 adenylosuccinate lyase [Salinivirgaceae bacterium]
MENSSLLSVSPVDGRYRPQVEELSNYLSEYGIMKYRVWVEIEYFIALCELPLPQLKDFPNDNFDNLRLLYQEFSIKDAMRVKEIEKGTNHDVKAIEYFIKEQLSGLKMDQYLEFIHFGLTSQDINNTAFPAAFRDAVNHIYYPLLGSVITELELKVAEWEDVPMLARTHGQPASPTRLGKEIAVFVERITNQRELLKSIPASGKFGGATGNFNAHFVAYPNIDWVKFANDFVHDSLKLERLQTTTQISHYDDMATIFDNLRRINTILIDFSRDMWTYISMDYFKQKIKKGEVGSSAMPHKVNPIDFENAEGNLGYANAILSHLSEKLPISRLQRDLTDSTVIRNIGMPLGHTIIALKSILKGLNKAILNFDKLNADLEDNWSVVAEGIQTILRRENYPNPYEALKDLTRTNARINKESMHQFIDKLNVSDKIKEELKRLSPQNYTGIKLT